MTFVSEVGLQYIILIYKIQVKSKELQMVFWVLFLKHVFNLRRMSRPQSGQNMTFKIIVKTKNAPSG